MGCGILFPRDYRREWDVVGNDGVDGVNAMNAGKNEYLEYRGIGSETESEDEAWWENPNIENGTKVQVSVYIYRVYYIRMSKIHKVMNSANDHSAVVS